MLIMEQFILNKVKLIFLIVILVKLLINNYIHIRKIII